MTRPARQRPYRSAPWEIDLTILIICAVLVLVSAVLSVGPSGGVVLPFSGGMGMPRTCFSKQITGVDCPGCGLTRSFVAMGDGEIGDAWRFHRLGPLLFMLVFVQIPLRAYSILRGIPCPWRIESWGKGVMIWGSVVALWINWVVNLFTGAALGR